MRFVFFRYSRKVSLGEGCRLFSWTEQHADLVIFRDIFPNVHLRTFAIQSNNSNRYWFRLGIACPAGMWYNYDVTKPERWYGVTWGWVMSDCVGCELGGDGCPTGCVGCVDDDDDDDAFGRWVRVALGALRWVTDDDETRHGTDDGVI